MPVGVAELSNWMTRLCCFADADASRVRALPGAVEIDATNFRASGQCMPRERDLGSRMNRGSRASGRAVSELPCNEC